jgi:hypothetical protein
VRESENRVLKMFWPKREEVTGEWKKLHNKGLHDLHSSSNIVRMIKSRSKRWVGRVTHGAEEKCIQDFGGKNLGERDHLGGQAWAVFIWLRIGTRGVRLQA